MKKQVNTLWKHENSSSSVQPKSHSISHGVGLAQRALLLPDEVLRWNINESLILPISSFAARYPLPDLSLWQANEDLGFVTTGNIDEDKELNRQIIVDRLKNTPGATTGEITTMVAKWIIK